MEFDHIEHDDGRVLSVGDAIAVISGDEYDGLFGTIEYIDDAEDTGNPGYDVHCSFEQPVLEFERKKLEETFSSLYKMEKKIDDIALDDVIMDPNDILTVGKESDYTTEIFYTLKKDVRNYDCVDSYVVNTTRLHEARWLLGGEVHGDMERFLSEWKKEEGFHETSGVDHYCAWVDGQTKRYHISITENRIRVDKLFLDEASKKLQK